MWLALALPCVVGCSVNNDCQAYAQPLAQWVITLFLVSLCACNFYTRQSISPLHLIPSISRYIFLLHPSFCILTFLPHEPSIDFPILLRILVAVNACSRSAIDLAAVAYRSYTTDTDLNQQIQILRRKHIKQTGCFNFVAVLPMLQQPVPSNGPIQPPTPAIPPLPSLPWFYSQYSSILYPRIDHAEAGGLFTVTPVASAALLCCLAFSISYIHTQQSRLALSASNSRKNITALHVPTLLPMPTATFTSGSGKKFLCIRYMH